MQGAAEQVYRLTQPYLYGAWLQARGRTKEALPVFVALATRGPVQERGWGYLGWSNCVEETHGEEARLPMLERGVAVDPHLFILRQNIALSEDSLSRPQAANADGAKALALLDTPGHGGIRDTVAPFSRARMLSVIDSNAGDFHSAAARLMKDYSENAFAASIFSVRGVVARAFAGEHDLGHARAALDMHFGESAINLSVRDTDDLSAQAVVAAQAGDWSEVVRIGTRTQAIVARQGALRGLVTARIYPLDAYAHAMLGDLAAADRLIATTPDHCDVCLRVRAILAAIHGQTPRAEWWFARAIAENPSIPFAYANWGETLLRKGDFDGAIAKFTVANQKGPHFADPLEMWGEVLIAQNRSDLALAKFEEANKYAPNWGRLHLKWGEALLWAGDKVSAVKQFTIAKTLDLTPREHSELARVQPPSTRAGP
jgi:predicted negative regulator of RcsB-dependent stress response